MRVFVTGATGYIGGSVVRGLLEQGAEVSGLARSDVAAAALEAMRVRPVRGTLADWSLLIREAAAADAVVNAANADDPFAAGALLAGLEGSGKPLLHTSGSSVVGDMAAGERAAEVVREDDEGWPRFEKAGRVAIDREVMAASARGLRGIVICPSMIYGEGLGPKPDSFQVPQLIALAQESGVARHVGPGENIWSHVHIADLVELYLLALERAAAGSFYFVENGEARLRDIAAAIGRMLGLGGETEPIGLDEAAARWNASTAHYTFGSNSRVSAAKARRELGWTPSRPGLLEEIESGCYARLHAAGPATG